MREPQCDHQQAVADWPAMVSYLKKKMPQGQKTVIMGVGSVLRSDDGAGMYCVEQLKELVKQKEQLHNLCLLGGSTAPENFTGVIKDFSPDRLFIIDAAHMGRDVGKVCVLDMNDIGGISFSTHMLPLPIMLQYLALETGCEVICIGIQPENTEQGMQMCDKVQAAAVRLAEVFGEIV
jgi:hydrogenase 3 maturation protease